MTLTPALCASLLRLADVDHHADAKPHGPIQRFFAWFNHSFITGSARYEKGVSGILQRGTRFMLIYALILGALGASFVKLPTSFLPEEDQGRLMMMVQLPPGSSYTRTDAVLHQVESYLSKQADVTDYMTIVGINGDQASANGFIQLKDWSQRKGKGQDAASLARKMTADLSQIRDARVFVIMPALIRGLGSSDINSTLSTALGRQLRERLHRPRPRQEGLPAGRRRVPHEAGRPRAVARAQQPRRNGAVLDLRQHALDLRLAAPGTLQRHVLGRDRRPGAPRRELRRRDGKPSRKSSSQAAAGHRLSNGPASRTRNAAPARRRRRSTPSRCSSSSSASPRCTKAGRCRSPSCSSCRSA
jgi:hypothetical protein